MSSAEQEWIAQLDRESDPLSMLATFAKHYHYFSLNQVIAFTGLFQAIGATERESLADLADVLYEELGAGDPTAVHSRLFERFVTATGVDLTSLPLAREQVAAGVVDYVDTLHESFFKSSTAEAIAAYVFLESSAVETYMPLLAAVRRTGLFREDALVFFTRHATVEPNHKERAETLANRHVTEGMRPPYTARIELLRSKWEAFWRSLIEASVNDAT